MGAFAVGGFAAGFSGCGVGWTAGKEAAAATFESSLR